MKENLTRKPKQFKLKHQNSLKLNVNFKNSFTAKGGKEKKKAFKFLNVF